MRTVTSPSIKSASSNCVNAAIVPLSALSILIALNVATRTPCRWSGVRILDGSGRLRNRARTRGFDDGQVDQRREHAEQNRQPPDRRIGAELLEDDAAEPDAEEAANLVA